MAGVAAAPAGADAADGDNVCSICWNAPVDACRLDNCVHEFCADCITGVYRHGGASSRNCPLCRTEYTAAHRADGSAVNLERRVFVVQLAGVTHDGRQARVRALVPGTPVVLVREPNNPHDPWAVAVHDATGNSLGFVPRMLTPPFHVDPLLDAVVNDAGRFNTRDGREVAWASLLVQDR